MASSIGRVYWFDGKELRDYEVGFDDQVFKWNLVKMGGEIILMAMPDDAGLDFHPELLDKVCELKGWDRREVKPMGGGVRFKDGEIIQRSTHFGQISEEYQDEILRLLGLK